MSRVLRPTLLAQEVVEAVLDGRQAAAITLAKQLEPLSTGWAEKRKARASAAS